MQHNILIFFENIQLIKGNNMSIDFDVVISSPVYSIDMKSGLDTLQGVCAATRYIVPERKLGFFQRVRSRSITYAVIFRLQILFITC